MLASSHRGKPNLSDWRAESLRLTVFPAPQATPLDQKEWEEFLRTQPEQVQVMPRLSRFQAIGSWEEAPLPGASLVLRADPNRIDWRLQPRQDGEGVENFANIGTAPGAIDAFTKLMKAWLPRSPDMNRLAFGAVLLLPVPTLEEAYHILASLLPLNVDLVGVSDFLFQLNRRRNSEVLAIEINRLSKWSASAATMYEFEFTGSEVKSSRAPQQFAVRLELDINTVPEFEGVLPANQIAAVLDELVGLGKEIGQEGPIL